MTLVSPPATGSLGAIRAITLTAPDLQPVEEAWTGYMGYQVIRRGLVSPEAARSWAAPALAGAPILILGPESGEPTYLRFVQQPNLPGPDPGHSFGWEVTELTVQDSDALYERLKASPFRVARPPLQVPTYPYLKALHAVGPAGERLNLTWIMETRPDLAVARSFVGRCFIAVQGGPDLPASIAFYQSVFGNPASPIRDLPGLQLAVITLADGSKLELDQAPADAGPRSAPPGGLPTGLAMVTFECTDFEGMRDRFVGPAARGGLEPHPDRTSGVMTGPAGELIELVSL